MGRKNHNKDSDWSDDKKLKEENKKLKRTVQSLRKQLSRIDVDRYQQLQELVDTQVKEDKQFHDEPRRESKREEAKEKWRCFECGEGFLRLLVLNRPDGVFYIRKCSDCRHKTRVKRYSSDVQGIK